MQAIRLWLPRFVVIIGISKDKSTSITSPLNIPFRRTLSHQRMKAASPKAAAKTPPVAALLLIAAPVKEEGVAEAVEEDPVPGDPAPG